MVRIGSNGNVAIGTIQLALIALQVEQANDGNSIIKIS